MAYVGPAPILTDSSAYDAYGDTAGGTVQDGGNLDYDKYYIGESSMRGEADDYVNIHGSGDFSQYFFKAGEDWTFDFWIYPENDSEGKMQMGMHAWGNPTGSPDTPLSGTGATWYHFGYLMSESYGGGKWQIAAAGSWQYWDIPAGSGPLKWNHVTFTRRKGGKKLKFFIMEF